ncbi:helix-turn-helix domain-containing protein [Streptomyces sp. NPDC057099]|uniref:MmyB family transcriptional regulator n=1 Tax=Streptomyces sp. NPDC057099 TaxID=3346019 RepID=UPI00362D5A4A
MNVMSGGGAENLVITRILQQARARRHGADIPGFAAVFGVRATRGITQAETAKLAGVSRRWYNALETGRRENYSDTFLEAVRRILALNSDEWDIVYRIARGGRAPDIHPTDPPARTVPPALLLLVEHSLTWGVYLSDHRWDVLAHNAKVQEYLPWLASGVNVLECVLTWPEVRSQLVNWEKDWAMPAIAALRVDSEQWPLDERLQEIVAKVRLAPAARRLWNAPNLPTARYPASSSPRRLYLPQHGGKEFSIRPVALTPMELPFCRLVAITPAELVS